MPKTENQSIQNMSALVKMTSYIRYFYPSELVEKTDWDAFLYQNIERVEKAQNHAELKQQLTDLFQPYAPKAQIFFKNEAIPKWKTIKLNKGDILNFWLHIPVRNRREGVIDVTPSRILKVPLEENGKLPKFIGGPKYQFKVTIPDPNQPLKLAINDGLVLRLPHAQMSDPKDKPSGDLPYLKAIPEDVSFNSRAARLTTIGSIWGYMQHFYMYWPVLKTDWPALLQKNLAETSQIQPRQFNQQVQKMIAQMHDGHAKVKSELEDIKQDCISPFGVDSIEDTLVITRTQDKNIQLGDEVLLWNGERFKERLKLEKELVSGTEQWKTYKAIQNIMLGDCSGNDKNISLKTKRNRQEIAVNTSRIDYSQEMKRVLPVNELRPDVFSRLGQDAMYLDLTRISADHFDKAVTYMAQAKHLIFDLRGYPNQFAMKLLGHLSDQELKTAPFLIPMVTFPDGKQPYFSDMTSIWAEPQQPQLTRSVAFIVNGNGAISFAESILGIVDHYKLAKIVGSSSAGANGDVTRKKFPLKYSVVWTGLQVTKHDGSPLMNVGIQPTHPAKRTVAGVKAGRDELLEFAYTLLTNKKLSDVEVKPIQLDESKEK